MSSEKIKYYLQYIFNVGFISENSRHISFIKNQHNLISILDLKYSNVRKVGTNISNMKDDADRARM